MRQPKGNTLKSATVSTSYYSGAYQFAQKLAAEKQLCSHWLQAFKNTSSSERISAEYYQRLLDSAAIYLKEPCFGLKYGQHIDIASFNLLGYLAMASATLQEASKVVSQYGVLVSGVGQLDTEPVHCQEGQVELVKILWRPRTGNEHCSTQIIDGVLAGWVNFGRQFIGHKTPIHSVQLTNRQTNIQCYQAFFDCQVKLGGDENYICIERELFKAPLQQREPLVYQAIREKANIAIQQVIHQETSISTYISHRLPSLILSNQANIKYLANQLNTTPRSLQRKLSEENINFRQLLDNARHTLAIQLLQEKEQPLSHISGIIGFNEQSSFTRAFKRWTGKTPKQFQESL